MMFGTGPIIHGSWLCPSCEAVAVPDQGRHSNIITFPAMAGEHRPPLWRVATDVGEPLDHHDVLAVILELLRAAHHDVATVSDALTFGRAYVQVHPADVAARRGVLLLEQALAFMGVELPAAQGRP
jgi:hypothetical protein